MCRPTRCTNTVITPAAGCGTLHDPGALTVPRPVPNAGPREDHDDNRQAALCGACANSSCCTKFQRVSTVHSRIFGRRYGASVLGTVRFVCFPRFVGLTRLERDTAPPWESWDTSLGVPPVREVLQYVAAAVDLPRDVRRVAEEAVKVLEVRDDDRSRARAVWHVAMILALRGWVELAQELAALVDFGLIPRQVRRRTSCAAVTALQVGVCTRKQASNARWASILALRAIAALSRHVVRTRVARRLAEWFAVACRSSLVPLVGAIAPHAPDGSDLRTAPPGRRGSALAVA